MTERLTVAAGRFTQAPKLLPGLLPRGAMLFPGAFVVSLTGTSSRASLPLQLRTLTLAGPPEGVVKNAFASASEMAPPAASLPAKTAQAWAHFKFASQPKAGLPLTVTWYWPDGRILGTVPKPNVPEVWSFLREDGGIASGAWRAELRAGGVVVKELIVRIR